LWRRRTAPSTLSSPRSQSKISSRSCDVAAEKGPFSRSEPWLAFEGSGRLALPLSARRSGTASPGRGEVGNLSRKYAT
jgi:hypothetical protein